MEVRTTTRNLVDNVLGNLRARYEVLDAVGVGATGVQLVSSASAPATAYPNIQPRVVVNNHVDVQAAPPAHHLHQTSVQYNHQPQAQAQAVAGGYPTQQEQLRAVEKAAAAKRQQDAVAAAHKYAPATTASSLAAATSTAIKYDTGLDMKPTVHMYNATNNATSVAPPSPAAAPLPKHQESTPPPSPSRPSTGAPITTTTNSRGIATSSTTVPPINDAAFSPKMETDDLDRKMLVDQVMRDMGFTVAPPPGDNQAVAQYLFSNAATAQSPIHAASTVGGETVEKTHISHMDFDGAETPAPASAPGDQQQQDQEPTARLPADVPQPIPKSTGSPPQHQHQQHNQQAPPPPTASSTALPAFSATHPQQQLSSAAMVGRPAGVAAPQQQQQQQSLGTTAANAIVRGGAARVGDNNRPLMTSENCKEPLNLLPSTFTSSEIDDMLSKRDVPLDGKQRATLFRAAERAFGGIVGAKDSTTRVQKQYPNIILRKHAVPSVASVMRNISTEADRLHKNPVADGVTRRLPYSARNRPGSSARASSSKGTRNGKGGTRGGNNFVAMVEDPHRAHRLVAHNTAARRVAASHAPLTSTTEPYYPSRGTGKSKVEWRASSVSGRKPKTIF